MEKCFKHIDSKKVSLIYVSSDDDINAQTVGIHFNISYNDQLFIAIKRFSAKLKDIDKIKSWQETDF